MLKGKDHAYLLNDEDAAALWETIGFFVPPQKREGNEGVHSVIMKVILEQISGSRAEGVAPEGSFTSFLIALERRFGEGASFDLIESGRPVQAFDVWNGLIESAFCDPRHPLVQEMPYYRSIVGTVICQCLVAGILALNSDRTEDDAGPQAGSIEAHRDLWVERVLSLCERIVDVEPLLATGSGYFHRFGAGSAAQNHNVWVSLVAVNEWFIVWSPSVLALYNGRSVERIEEIAQRMAVVEQRFRESDR